MKARTFALLTVLLVFSTARAYIADSVPDIKSYLAAMQQLAKSCRMDYRATCTYPDKSSFKVAGHLAIHENFYYDSSNVRFIMMNSRWLVMAEHENKMLSVVNLPEWKKHMGKDFDLDISGYLLGTEEMKDFSSFKISPSGNDSFIVYAQYRTGEGQTVSLVLHYGKGSLIPGRYEGNITYPAVSVADEETQPGAEAKVWFACSNIRQAPAMELFNDARLIKETGKGKAQMRRYNDYRMYKKSL